MRQRRLGIIGGFPYLVAQRAGEIVGLRLCVAVPLKVGLSLYRRKLGFSAPGWTGRGIGRQLMLALLTECEAKGLGQIVAVIGDSANSASIALHRRLGFAIVGTIRSAGCKFGRWVDSVLMQRSLGAGDSTLP